jgi:3-hydroxyacyl-CoA dehydrogenase
LSVSSVQKVAVLGAGQRGRQIAALIAQGGVPVLLLDKKVEGEELTRSGEALAWIEKSPLSPLSNKQNLSLITAGDAEADFEKLGFADWIIEAVPEDIELKAVLYDKIDAVRKRGAVVSATSSRFGWTALMEGRSEEFRHCFSIACFSMPLHDRRLLTFVAGTDAQDGNISVLSAFCERNLDRVCVVSADAPGLIADRIGLYFVQAVVNATRECGLSIEEADYICGKIGQRPFALLDRLGIDKWLAAATPLAAELASGDAFGRIYHEQALFKQMVKAGYSGRDGKGGFYRCRRLPEGVVNETLNLQTGAYVEQREVGEDFKSLIQKKFRALFEEDHKGAKFLWRVLSQTLSYAAFCLPQVGASIFDIDRAMKAGAGWLTGPFEAIDAIGVDWFMARLREDNKPIPAFLLKAAGRTFYAAHERHFSYLSLSGDYVPVQRSEGVLLLKDLACAATPVAQNDVAKVWDLGEGILCFSFDTKAHSLTPEVLDFLDETITAIETGTENGHKLWRGLILYNEEGGFSAGYNLELLAKALSNREWGFIESYFQKGRRIFRRLRYTAFPTVAAVKGYALGGAMELLLHLSSVQVMAECKMGLVGMNMGILPALGGLVQLYGRATAANRQFGGDTPPVNRVFETIAEAKMSRTAIEAMDLLYLRPSDGVSMNEERLLGDAKKRILDMLGDYKPPKPWNLSFSGAAGRAALELSIEGYRVGRRFSPHDVVVCRALSTALCGGEREPTGPIVEDQMLAVAHRELMRLIQMPETFERVAHFLETGEKLKN